MSENTPTGSIDLNLDVIERDKSYTPFRVNVGGRVIEMTDPSEFDWKDLSDIEQPVQFFKYACDPDTRAYLLGQKIPGWKLGKLIEAYMAHYGLENKGNVEGLLT
jgi:hypothetical protein